MNDKLWKHFPICRVAIYDNRTFSSTYIMNSNLSYHIISIPITNYHIHSFVHDTNISQSGHQKDFPQFYFHEVDKTASVTKFLQDIEVVGNSQLYFHECL